MVSLTPTTSRAPDTAGNVRATVTGPAERAGGYWRLTGALLVVLVAVSLSLSGLIQGVGWLVLMLFVGSLILAFEACLRAVGAKRWLVPLLGLGLLLVVITIGFADGTAIAGFIPTGATVEHFIALGGQANASISEQSSPAPELHEFMFLVAVGAGVFAIITDFISITLRRPAFAGIAIVAVVAAPATLSAGVSPLALAGAAAAYFYLLRSDVRTRRPGTPRVAASLAIVAASIVPALLIATTAPGFAIGGTSTFSAAGILIGQSVSPLINIGQDLRRPAAVQTLTYSTSVAHPPYLKLTSLDDFTGSTWRHTPAETKRLPSGDTIGPSVGLSKAVKTTRITTTIHIDDMTSEWLPLPSPVLGVHGLSGLWSWDPSDLTVGAVNNGTTTRGQTYTAVSEEIQPTAAQLANAGGVVPAAITRDLALPGNLPSIITITAEKATLGATNEYQQAVQLQNYFRTHGFVYSTNTPLKEGFDGDGAKVIARFLQVKSGYCVHFASAMALMARVLGIPSRVDMGYLPGAANTGATHGPSSYTVTSDDLHAWPELYFAGVGWVPFEPTVGQGTVPTYTLPKAAATPTVPAPVLPAAGATKPGTANQHSTSSESTPTTGSVGRTPTVGGVIVVLAILLLLAVPFLIRQSRRIFRIRGLRRSRTSARWAWSEVQATARDIGLSASPTETPRVFAARVSQHLPDGVSRGALQELLSAVEHELFARPGADMSEPDVETLLTRVRAAMFNSVGVRARIRAYLLPVSLFPEGWVPAARTSA